MEFEKKRRVLSDQKDVGVGKVICQQSQSGLTSDGKRCSIQIEQSRGGT
jgi:hypothetical protein